MKTEDKREDPVNFKDRGKTLSNKPWGIACYALTTGMVLKKHWLFGSRYIRDNTLVWAHLVNHWYNTKKSQLQALEDLTKKYTEYRFIPFKNNHKQMPQDRIKMKTLTL